MDAVTEKKKVGRPPTRKRLLTLRLEPEVVDYYKEVGQTYEFGWLQKVNDTLKRSMEVQIDQERKRLERNIARKLARKQQHG
jgi:uncharacterized protein (DUF4415 family)